MRTGPAPGHGFSEGKLGSESATMARAGLEREKTDRQTEWSNGIKKQWQRTYDTIEMIWGERVRFHYHVKTLSPNLTSEQHKRGSVSLVT